MRNMGIFLSIRMKFYLGMMALVIITQIINAMTLIGTREKEINSEVLFNALLFAEYNSEEIVEYYGSATDISQEKLFSLIDTVYQKNRDIEAIYVIDEQKQIVVSPRSYGERKPIKENFEQADSTLLQRMVVKKPTSIDSQYKGRTLLDVLYPMEGEYDGKDYFVRFLFNYDNQEASVSQMRKQMFLNGLTSIIVGMVLIILISHYFTRPIKRLVKHVKRVSSGDFSSEVSISSKDELGTLFRSFNTMQNELKQSFSDLISTRDELARLNEDLEKRVKERTAELHEKNEQLEVLSITDKLTGCFNRAKLDTVLEELHDRFANGGNEFSVIMIDLDFFKQVNDSYGHATGDYVLKESALVIKETVGDLGVVGRWGGEEFMIVCPNAKQSHAVALAEDVRKSIAEHQFEDVGQRTASFGVSTVAFGDTFETLNSRADEAMYQAKSDGRDRVIGY
ncbi:diguanylate cyclase [uncultured Vibrio sp.]|uniref:diguanylate cyclase n=1 Tax=uncultured Vibrio sp. TaxID=114054 RepID=UPI0025D6141D|nr:diguanylate cyclase [uncultured Vibrio sp.]